MEACFCKGIKTKGTAMFFLTIKNNNCLVRTATNSDFLLTMPCLYLEILIFFFRIQIVNKPRNKKSKQLCSFFLRTERQTGEKSELWDKKLKLPFLFLCHGRNKFIQKTGFLFFMKSIYFVILEWCEQDEFLSGFSCTNTRQWRSRPNHYTNKANKPVFQSIQFY